MDNRSTYRGDKKHRKPYVKPLSRKRMMKRLQAMRRAQRANRAELSIVNHEEEEEKESQVDVRLQENGDAVLLCEAQKNHCVSIEHSLNRTLAEEQEKAKEGEKEEVVSNANRSTIINHEDEQESQVDVDPQENGDAVLLCEVQKNHCVSIEHSLNRTQSEEQEKAREGEKEVVSNANRSTYRGDKKHRKPYIKPLSRKRIMKRLQAMRKAKRAELSIAKHEDEQESQVDVRPQENGDVLLCEAQKNHCD